VTSTARRWSVVPAHFDPFSGTAQRFS